MERRTTILAAAAVALALAAGCSADPVKQLTTNEQLRGQLLDAIGRNRLLATQVVDRVMASDSLRFYMVDHMLGNDEVAKQVIVRIGTNPTALDLVLAVAAKDSTTREHVRTLLKGMEMASPHH